MYTQYDVIVVVTILISMTVCLVKGGVSSIIGILKWYGAFFVALYFYPEVKKITAEHIVDSMIGNVAAVIVVYILAVIALTIVGSILIKAFSFTNSIPDKIFGAGVGFVLGYLMVSFVHYSMQEILKESAPEWFVKAETHSFTQKGANFIKEYFQGSLESMKEELGVDVTDEEGNIDPEKAKQFLEKPEVKKIMNNPEFKEMMNDSKVQEAAREKINNANVDLDINKIVERANQLKELGYEPDEIKSIIEQEQQINR